MSDGDRIRILRSAKELEGLNDAQLRALLPFLDEVTVPAGMRLAQEGRPSHEFLIVAAGELDTCRHGMRDKLVPGDTFGWTAMQEHGWNDATLTAESSVTLLAMGHAQFRAVKAFLSDRVRFSEPALSRGLVR